METGISRHLEHVAITREHYPFVVGTFSDCLQAESWMTSESRHVHERALLRALRDPSALAIVVTPRGYPDELIGWSVAMPTALLFAYVRYPFRRGRLGHHFGTDLIERVCQSWVPCAVWTRAASRMAAKGFPTRYDIDEHEKFLQLAR